MINDILSRIFPPLMSSYGGYGWLSGDQWSMEEMAEIMAFCVNNHIPPYTFTMLSTDDFNGYMRDGATL